jgi:hypothetical protein
MKQFFLMLLVFSSSLYSTLIFSNEWSGNISFDYRYFSKDALVSTQFKEYGSVAIQPEWFHEWDGGKQSFIFVPFYRWDEHDKERTHADIRELSWLKVFDESELRIGVRKVFWGVTESQHLVDIINQTDLVESIDGEEKLGQPMINYALIQDWGTVDFFVLPYFRERTFSGINGRLRSTLYVDTDNPVYESKDKENHIDYAIRWSHSIGDWDIGLSHFNGTSRDPSFEVGLDSGGNSVLKPVYNLIQQTGLDIQATKDAWLWKMEVINRSSKDSSYVAATGGFEHTFYGVLDSTSDLGLVVEYSYDDRKKQATTPLENDVLLAVRWTKNDVNDTSLLMGVVSDLDDSSRLYSIEASRRLGESWKLNLEARVFSGINDSNSLLYSIRHDDFVQLELAYYF